MIYKLFLWAQGVLALLLVPATFYFSDVYQNVFQKTMKLQVDPAFSGGEVIARFTDSYRDDYGGGTLQYPLEQAPGALDLLEYRVYKPQLDAPWSDIPHYWQLGVTLADWESIDKLILRIYIDYTDGGATESPAPEQELIAFSGEHPWDILVEALLGENQMNLIDKEGNLISQGPVYRDPHKNQIYLRLPLEGELAAVLDGRKSYHLILSGYYDEISAFQPLKRTPNLRNTGGAKNARTPRVFDWIPPEGSSQEVLLSQIEPVLTFLEVDPDHPALLENNPVTVIEETQENTEALESELGNPDLSSLEIASLLVRLGRHKEAEELLQKILQESREPQALAYLATLRALKAGDTNPMEAMSLLDEAFALYDEALSLNPTDAARVDILIHRAYVSRSIPEAIFGKASDGAEDFIHAAEILETIEGPSSYLGKLYRLAADCYRIAGKEGQAEMTLLKSEAFQE